MSKRRMPLAAPIIIVISLFCMAAQPHRSLAAPDARTSWLQAQRTFMTALEGLAAGTNDASAQWPRVLSTFIPYMDSSNAWFATPARLQESLLSTHGLSYVVRDWERGILRVREIVVSDGTPPCYDGRHFLARLLFWQTATGVHAQVLAQQTTPPTPMLKGSGVLLDEDDMVDLHIWARGTTRFAAYVERYPCPNGGPLDTIRGSMLLPGASVWVHDPTMFPIDIYGASVDNLSAGFTDHDGRTIQLSASLVTPIFHECHLCLHVEGMRNMVRHGDRYVAQPWHILPGPYATLVQVISALAKLGSPCEHLLPYVATAEIAQHLCNLPGHPIWIQPSLVSYAPVSMTSDPARVYTFVVDTSQAEPTRLIMEVKALHGRWLVTSVQP